MPPSLLYHGFGMAGYKYVHTRHENGAVVFRVTNEIDNQYIEHLAQYIKQTSSWHHIFEFNILKLKDNNLWHGICLSLYLKKLPPYPGKLQSKIFEIF